MIKMQLHYYMQRVLITSHHSVSQVLHLKCILHRQATIRFIHMETQTLKSELLQRSKYNSDNYLRLQ